MKLFRPRSKFGFTIIELMVSLAILMLLVGGLLAGFNSFNQDQIVKQASQSLKANLRLAQSRALSALKPAGCISPVNLELVGYQVSFTSNSYSIQAVCTNGVGQTLIGSTTDVLLPPSLTFSPEPGDLLFGVLTRGIVGAAGSVTIRIAGLQKNYQLVVSPNGEITDIGFQ